MCRPMKLDTVPILRKMEWHFISLLKDVLGENYSDSF